MNQEGRPVVLLRPGFKNAYYFESAEEAAASFFSNLLLHSDVSENEGLIKS